MESIQKKKVSCKKHMDQKAQKNYRGTSKSERPKWVECFKIERILGGALKCMFYSGGIIFLPLPQKSNTKDEDV